MDFGSKYVYHYDVPDIEYISDEEFDQGMDVSDSDSDHEEDLLALGSTRADGPAPPPSTSKTKGKKVGHWRSSESQYKPPGKGRKERRADTNIVSINFQTLVSPSNMHTGDAVYCEGCQAVLSNTSKLQTQDDKKIWTCEFCSTRNELDIEDEEKPSKDDVTFMLTPALSTASSGPAGTDNTLVIFCVDISGSMCLTTEVAGRINLRGGNLRRMASFNDDRSDQYLPSQNRNVTYISRLQSVQAAVDQQLEEMVKEHPNRRVALIVFNNEVVVIGDGKSSPVTIAGDKLKNKEELVKIGSTLSTPSDIKSTRRTLGDKLFELEEGGSTALGPALTVAATMASQQPGSKVIMCTDGLANVGLGRLDIASDEVQENAMTFYEDLADDAMNKGVSVSVISIKGTDCKLIHLGKVADKTSGQINMVDPVKLTQEFATILEDRIIATNVVATFILHKQLFFHYEDTKESKNIRNVGNVTAETEITFEYGVRTKEDKKQQSAGDAGMMESDATSDKQTTGPSTGGDEPVQGSSQEGSTSTEGATNEQKEEEELKELPFQLQIKYTDTDGAVALRVLTQRKPITRDRNLAEKELNFHVLGKHAAQTSAALALEGKYTEARTRGMMNQRLAWRHKKTKPHHEGKAMYGQVFSTVKTVDMYLNSAQKSEARSNQGRTYSDEEDDAMDEAEQAGTAAKGGKSKSFLGMMLKKKKMVKRGSHTTDEAANMLYDMKQKPGKAFKK